MTYLLQGIHVSSNVLLVWDMTPIAVHQFSFYLHPQFTHLMYCYIIRDITTITLQKYQKGKKMIFLNFQAVLLPVDGTFLMPLPPFYMPHELKKYYQWDY